MRLIDADKAMESIAKSKSQIKGSEYESTLLPMFELLENCIESCPTESDWILCSDELPKRYESVLTTSRDGRVRENFLTALGNDMWSYDSYQVIAWMPMPEPYVLT